jgi:hypothetical protein
VIDAALCSTDAVANLDLSRDLVQFGQDRRRRHGLPGCQIPVALLHSSEQLGLGQHRRPVIVGSVVALVIHELLLI